MRCRQLWRYEEFNLPRRTDRRLTTTLRRIRRDRGGPRRRPRGLRFAQRRLVRHDRHHGHHFLGLLGLIRQLVQHVWQLIVRQLWRQRLLRQLVVE